MAQTKKEKEAAAKRSEAAKKAAATRKANAEVQATPSAPTEPTPTEPTPTEPTPTEPTPTEPQGQEDNEPQSNPSSNVPESNDPDPGNEPAPSEEQLMNLEEDEEGVLQIPLGNHSADVRPDNQHDAEQRRQLELAAARYIHQERTEGRTPQVALVKQSGN